MIRRPMSEAYTDGTPMIFWRDGIPTTAAWSPDAGLFIRADMPEPYYDSVVGATEWEPIGSLTIPPVAAE